MMEKILRQIDKPTLLLDKQRVLRNIDRMVEKAGKNDVLLRPHFKTHQSAEIGEWFRSRGVHAITVSSVDMAEYFVDHGWKDVTIAFPVNLRQIGKINDLAKNARIHTLVESEDVVRILDGELSEEISIWLKIDAGYHRTGIRWDDDVSIASVARAVRESRSLTLRGILTHSGHTYGTGSPTEIRTIYSQTLERMLDIRQSLERIGFDAAISVGDTPSCSIVEDFGEIDEIRPGNFVFYDLSQAQFGSCRIEDIAVAAACPVVAKHSDRNQIVIYGGAIHLSKESLAGKNSPAIFGQVGSPAARRWTAVEPECDVISLSQEHGIIRASDRLFHQTEVGDILLILPVHSCLTANLLGRYLTLDGEVIEMARF
jgi:D-serine deaminase-like pyridoxal phosphate-dependent protein